MNFLNPSARCNTKIDAMKDIPKGKFCSLCQKKVHDLSEYSHSEIEELIRNNPKGFCAKIEPRHTQSVFNSNERKLSNDFIESKKVEYSHSSRFTLLKTTAIASSLLFYTNTVAQKNVSNTEQTIKKHASVEKLLPENPQLITITGTTNLKNMEYLNVSLYTLEKVYHTQLNEDGSFSLQIPPSALRLINLFSINSSFDEEFFEVKKEDLKNLKFNSQLKDEYLKMPYGGITIQQPSPTTLIALNGKFTNDNKAISKSLQLFSDRYTLYRIPKVHMHIFTKKENFTEIFLIYID